MTTLYDQSGAEVRIADSLGKGGEGTVHAVTGDASIVAKVFVPKRRTDAKRRKLQAMVAHPPEGAYDLAHGFPVLTWPRAVLYSDAEEQDASTFVGYTMARIRPQDFVPVFRVSSAVRREALGGEPVTWDRLVRFAARLCHVVRTLHRFGYAVGDLNDRNVLVSRGFTPLLMDTDSFQVPKLFGHHPSTVGDQLYWPPELLDVDLSQYRGGRALGDRFALGTLLFQLFMNGMRPYQAKGSLVADLDTLEAKTRAGHFPWVDPDPGVLEPPAGAPEFHALPKSIRRAFERCFVAGHRHPRRRPSAVQWVRILHKTVRRGFVTCTDVKSHVYGTDEDHCPWCQDAKNPFGAPKRPPPGRVPSRRTKTRRQRKQPAPTRKKKERQPGAGGDRTVIRVAWQALLLAAFITPFFVLRTFTDSVSKQLITSSVPVLVVAVLGAWVSVPWAHSIRGQWRLGGAWAITAAIGLMALLWTGPHPWADMATGVACLLLGVAVLVRMDPRGPSGWRPDRRGTMVAALSVATAYVPIVVLAIAA